MSAGAIAMAAVLVSGSEVLGLIAAGAWLVYTKRIVLAATPKDPAPPKEAQAVPEPARSTP